MPNKFKQKAQEILELADIKINPLKPRDWDIQVHNEKFYERVFSGGSLAFGESYMDKWWDCKRLDIFFTKIFLADLDKKVRNKEIVFLSVKSKLLNMQSVLKAKKVARVHYGLGNDFYRNMLDKRMQYTCAYWKNTKNLDKAQEAKLDLVCRKLGLKKGDKVLELGSGWGGFAKYAAEKYGVQVECYNISKEQVEYARKNAGNLPIRYHLEDYRNARGKFDHVVSIGFMEHVGYKNYVKLMGLVNDKLKEGGLFLLHTIGSNFSRTSTDPWIDKYIFPGGMLPSITQIGKSSENIFVMEDWHNFGSDYDKTLITWAKNFSKNWHKWEKIYGNRFKRMWEFYLYSSAGRFRSRRNQLWQIVFSKGGVLGGYKPVR